LNLIEKKWNANGAKGIENMLVIMVLGKKDKYLKKPFSSPNFLRCTKILS
jgi:hypothetical protein